MTEEFSHLFPFIRPIAALSAEERIRRICADRWIAYPGAEQAPVSQIPTHPVSKLCATNLKIVRQMACQALESHKFRLSDNPPDEPASLRFTLRGVDAASRLMSDNGALSDIFFTRHLGRFAPEKACKSAAAC
jgi:hypothetical protein